jgi:hypothetical protein
MYGSSWPDPPYPPYYAAPPSGYYFGAALATGLTFAAGAAVGGLWGLGESRLGQVCREHDNIRPGPIITWSRVAMSNE